mgnify:FL=1
MKRLTKVCTNCNKEFFKPVYCSLRNWDSVRKCCSSKCQKERTLFKKGSVPVNKGLKQPQISGKNHWNWRGGISGTDKNLRNSLELKLWRTAVFKRDNFTCIFCEAKNGLGETVILNADHIKPWKLFPELRFVVDNGRTLCVDCHRKTSTYGCLKNYKEE